MNNSLQNSFNEGFNHLPRSEMYLIPTRSFNTNENDFRGNGLVIDIFKNGNRLRANAANEIEVIPKTFYFVIGEYLQGFATKVSKFAREVFAPTSFGYPTTDERLDKGISELTEKAKKRKEAERLESSNNYIYIKEIDECSENLEEAEKRAGVCEIPATDFMIVPKNGTIEENFKLGREILLDIQQMTVFSPNNLARNRQVIEEHAVKQNVVLNSLQGLTQAVGSCLSNQRFNGWNRKGSFFIKVMSIAKVVSRTLIGNCGEMAYLSLLKGMEKGVWNTHLDVVFIKNGDHVFLVVGRNSMSDPDDYKTWGSSAVVVDPWAGKVYPLSEVEAQLEDYFGFDSKTGEPGLRPFDPQKQKLEIITGNIFFPQELLAIKKRVYLDTEEDKLFDEIIHYLKDFHQEEVLQEKLVTARALYRLCTKPTLNHLEVITLLRDQVNFFIELNH